MEDKDLAGLSRADLLARCQAAGLKATAWKKERMLEELLKPEKPAANHEEPREQEQEPGPPADEKPYEPEPLRGPLLSGWCSRNPMWSMHHLGCRLASQCPCGCHTDGWERPGYPEGAKLSKFNPDRPRGEFD